jgi:hypothetical protein
MPLIRNTYFFFLIGILLGLKAQAQNDEVLKGKLLAEIYCASCHAFPSPSLLPKDVWIRQVLPQMAATMGIKEAQDSLGVWENKSKEEVAILKDLGIYPSVNLISKEDFQTISDFYGVAAPKELPAQNVKIEPLALQSFLSKTLFIEGITSPKTSLVAINEERQELIIADGTENQLFVKDQNDELFTLPSTTSPAVHYLKKAPNVYDFISIGSISPSDVSEGTLFEMDLNSNTWISIKENLSRPVFGTWEDLEKDGTPDFIICNYGHHVGDISIYSNGILDSAPIILGGAGARKIEVADLNSDGLMDIVALFCQGNERVSVFYNQGNGQFDFEKILLRFSPVMGSSYFEMQDFNEDGKLDFLVSNGDNWDYSSVPKPYHGFRIYENKGDGIFEEVWFYPQYGAAKAMALDYDQDGDLDIATIAFYDELRNPEHQFLLFENIGNLSFKPRFIPEAALGKWLTMDIGDLDSDGDKDIVLGAYTHNFLEYSKLLFQGINEIPNVLILENLGSKKE